ncbi:MAG TPA: glutathione S-transferase C-terminal domain-containing protein [Novosphingobium sp.]|nr:glutathione S-transferase C-terminal domain-containing protein [Novosphingobium sp.]
MKLYYMPGACSLAAHIVLNEIDADFELVAVDPASKQTALGEDFRTISPNGYVPALSLDDGFALTEAPAILQFLADANPAAGLAPDNATRERAVLQQHLNFLASELHKAFAPFFSNPDLAGAEREAAIQRLSGRLDHLEALLGDGRDYLLGERFSVADAYAGVIASWANHIGIGLGAWPSVGAFVARVVARPAAQDALRSEGLLN